MSEISREILELGPRGAIQVFITWVVLVRVSVRVVFL
jgi:hypothetical protein